MVDKTNTLINQRRMKDVLIQNQQDELQMLNGHNERQNQNHNTYLMGGWIYLQVEKK